MKMLKLGFLWVGILLLIGFINPMNANIVFERIKKGSLDSVQITSTDTPHARNILQ